MTERIKEVLSEDELTRLERFSAECTPWVAARMKAWLEFTYCCTLRISESLDLTPRDYDKKNGIILIRKGKGGKHRKVAIGPRASQALDNWLKIRGNIGDNKPIFCTEEGNRLHRVNVYNQMRKIARRAHVDKRVHPHQLRYSGASTMLRKGANIAHIQGQLGHHKPSTTMIYLLDVDPMQRVEDQKRWEP